MEHGAWIMWREVILELLHNSKIQKQKRKLNLCYFWRYNNSVCLMFFFASFAGSQRAHASGALASFGSIRRRKKNNAEENRRITKNKIN